MTDDRPERTDSDRSAAPEYRADLAARNRRQQVFPSGGFGLQPADGLRVTRRDTGRWNTEVVEHLGLIYAASTSPIGTANPFARADRIDPVTLASTAVSDELPTGGHIWPGGLVSHPNGDLYLLAGNGLYRLDSELRTVSSLELPPDRAHDGLMVMEDGRLILKDVRLPGEPAGIIFVVDADIMTILTQGTIPEPSMHRFAADGNDLYIPGDQSIFRYRYRRGGVSRDTSWTGRYRVANGDFGVASDISLGGQDLWVHDNTDTLERRDLLSAHPVGSLEPPKRFEESFSTAHRLHRISLSNSSNHVVLTPFAVFDSWVVGAPTSTEAHGVVVTGDSRNGGMAGFRREHDGSLTKLWRNEVHPRWQPVVYEDTAEIVVNDFHIFDDDNIVVVDLHTGQIKARSRTGSARPSTGGAIATPQGLLYLAGSSLVRVCRQPGPGWAAPHARDVALLPPPGWL